MQILSYPLYQFYQISELKQDIIKKSEKEWIPFTIDKYVNKSLNIIYYFQQAFVSLMKKIKEVMKMNLLSI